MTLVGWLRGRKRRVANAEASVSSSVGSNPTPTVGHEGIRSRSEKLSWPQSSRTSGIYTKRMVYPVIRPFPIWRYEPSTREWYPDCFETRELPQEPRR